MSTGTIERVDPAKTALLMMDYQQGILARLPDADALLTRAQEAIEPLRSRGVTIGYVRVGFADGEKPAGRMGKLVTPQVLPMLHADAPATQIHDAIAPQSDDIVVRKVRVGPFGTTDLDKQLRAKGVDTLLLAGLTTSGVVLTAVRDAHDRDYRVIVVSDLTADPDPDVHAFLLERIFSPQAEVVQSGDLPHLFA